MNTDLIYESKSLYCDFLCVITFLEPNNSCFFNVSVCSVTLRWRLHFEFVTAREPVELPTVLQNQSEVTVWTGAEHVDVDTFSWDLPIKVLPTNPALVSYVSQFTGTNSISIWSKSTFKVKILDFKTKMIWFGFLFSIWRFFTFRLEAYLCSWCFYFVFIVGRESVRCAYYKLH